MLVHDRNYWLGDKFLSTFILLVYFFVVTKPRLHVINIFKFQRTA